MEHGSLFSYYQSFKMHKLIQILLFPLLCFCFISFGGYSQTQSSCPFNAVNCAYGCGRHIDQDNDGYCDHSILDLPKTIKDTVELNDSVSGGKKHKVKQKAVHSEHKKNKDAIVAKPIVNQVDTSSQAGIVLNEDLFDADKEEIQAVKAQPKPRPLYDLIEVSALTFFLYFLTFFLSKRGFIRKLIHRRIWNALLLLTFIVSCLFGFWLVIMINYGIAMSTFRTFLYWHVEVGISMTLISVFHILWHLTYFKNIFRMPSIK